MICLVEWEDAFIETDDFSLQEGRKTEPVYRSTVGFLVATNDKGIVLATDEYKKKSDGFAARMFIPWGLVLDWYEVQWQDS